MDPCLHRVQKHHWSPSSIRYLGKNKCFTSDNYQRFVATSVTSTEREKTQRLRDNGETVPEHILTAAAEHRGVGFAIHNKLIPTSDIIQIVSGRIAVATMNGATQYTFITCYAPHPALPEQDKVDFYKDLQVTFDNTCAENIRVLGGDFNAKLAKVICEDYDNFGPHMLEATQNQFDNMAEKTRANRDLFMNFVEANGLWVPNTHYQKRVDQKCTCYRIGTNTETDTRDYEHFVETDYILWDSRWKNKNGNTEVDSLAYTLSDHFLVWGVIKGKFAKKRKAEQFQHKIDYCRSQEMKARKKHFVTHLPQATHNKKNAM